MSLSSISFADIAHQNLNFNPNNESDQLVLKLIDTPWVQRLRRIKQTGNTNLVYMFAEHSRFGHSLGVAYLALTMMNRLEEIFPEVIKPYKNAVAVAALLHDIGHVAPGSHLAEKVWGVWGIEEPSHEELTIRIINQDPDINGILKNISSDLPEQVSKILLAAEDLPPWTWSIISGDGWNADRGNWAIVDSAMCAVSYGRYNVMALIDAFTLNSKKELVIKENRLDALTHFFLARDSMYRQVYQHRVLQVADTMYQNIIWRVRQLLVEKFQFPLFAISFLKDKRQEVKSYLASLEIFVDEVMLSALLSNQYTQDLTLDEVFSLTEDLWNYHLNLWTGAKDKIVSDFALRIRDRQLFKTVRLSKEELSLVKNSTINISTIKNLKSQLQFLETQFPSPLYSAAIKICLSQGFDPSYYLFLVSNYDKHRKAFDSSPKVLLETNQEVLANQVEPIINLLMQKNEQERIWLAMPKEVKAELVSR